MAGSQEDSIISPPLCGRGEYEVRKNCNDDDNGEQKERLPIQLRPQIFQERDEKVHFRFSRSEFDDDEIRGHGDDHNAGDGGSNGDSDAQNAEVAVQFALVFAVGGRFFAVGDGFGGHCFRAQWR